LWYYSQQEKCFSVGVKAGKLYAGNKGAYNTEEDQRAKNNFKVTGG